MPANIAIAAFVLGAVLLLISILKGGFKIFGAEVSATTGSVSRLLAFVLGITFIVTGFFVDQPKVDQPTYDEPKAAVARSASSEVPVSSSQRQSEVANPSTPVHVIPSEPPASNPFPRTPEPAARLNVSWRESTQELIRVLDAIPPEEKLNLSYAVILTGVDIYGAHVRFANTGSVPVMISPDHIRIHYGYEQAIVSTIDHPLFLRAGVLPPGQSREGLVIFKARIDIGAGIRLGQGALSYDDDSVEVSYTSR
jgi:hypothetical protein